MIMQSRVMRLPFAHISRLFHRQPPRNRSRCDGISRGSMYWSIGSAVTFLVTCRCYQACFYCCGTFCALAALIHIGCDLPPFFITQQVINSINKEPLSGDFFPCSRRSCAVNASRVECFQRWMSPRLMVILSATFDFQIHDGQANQ